MIYNKESINHFKNNLNCKIIHLSLSLKEFKSRVDNLENRGVINPNVLTIEELYLERIRLCDINSDYIINADCKEKAFKELLELKIDN